jgi:hypothetical protein
MTQEQQPQQGEKREFLPLGSIVILKGSVKKLMIVARASIVEDDFFDYGAFMYPEGLIDTNVAYFKREDILKVVHEGFSDDDDHLVVEIMSDAYHQFLQRRDGVAASPEPETVVPVPPSAQGDDPFASVRDLMHHDA